MFFIFQAEDGIRDTSVTGVQTCALPIYQKRRGKGAMEFCKEDFLHTILPAFASVLVCVALIRAQPDLGTSLAIPLLARTLVFLARLSWQWRAPGSSVALPPLYLLIRRAACRLAG